MDRFVVVIAAVLTLLGVVAPVRAAAHSPARVLTIHDYGKETPADVICDDTLQRVLRADLGPTTEYYTEFLDFGRFGEEGQAVLMRDYLQRKYRDRPVDVIVATNRAATFLLRFKDDVFVHTPIVYATALSHTAVDDSGDVRLTGVQGEFDARSTLELALRLHPGTREVFVISGTPERDHSVESRARQQLADLEHTVEITYLTDISAHDAIEKMASLPSQSLVLFISLYERAPDGQILFPRDIATEMARRADVPVYGVLDAYLKDGVVGGYMLSVEGNAAKTAELSLRILRGERPQNIPPIKAEIVPTFDWRQLKRWGISESRLPPGSVVRFREPTLWEAHQRYVIGAVTLSALEMGLIAALLIERRRRLRALHELAQREEEREQLVAARAAEEALREADRRKDFFLAILAHELRNPLNSIRMASELMRVAAKDEGKMTRAREVIERQSGQLVRLVDDLLDVSRITQDKIQFRFEPIDLVNVVSHAVDAAQALLAESGVRFSMNLCPRPARVRGDTVRLSQVISNLLSNAAKFTEKGGSVSLTLERRESDVALEIVDDGVGIPEDMLDRIFDLFTQAARSRVRSQGGLGIGLTLVKRIVEVHGGTILVASQGVGQGSRFTVLLPLLVDHVDTPTELVAVARVEPFRASTSS